MTATTTIDKLCVYAMQDGDCIKYHFPKSIAEGITHALKMKKEFSKAKIYLREGTEHPNGLVFYRHNALPLIWNGRNFDAEQMQAV